MGLVPGSGRYPGKGTGYPLQYYCLENSLDKEVHGLESMGSQGVQGDTTKHILLGSQFSSVNSVLFCKLYLIVS